MRWILIQSEKIIDHELEGLKGAHILDHDNREAE